MTPLGLHSALAAGVLGLLAACSSASKSSHDPLSIARAPVAAAINDYQRCAETVLPAQQSGLNPVASVFVVADAALASCSDGLARVRQSILADNAGHPYVAGFAEEASTNIRLRTRNVLAHSLNRQREASPAPATAKP